MQCAKINYCPPARATINVIRNVRHTTPYSDRLKATAIPRELSRQHARQLTASRSQPTTSPRLYRVRQKKVDP